MIDVHQPIELDDGRPARIVKHKGAIARVEIRGPWNRDPQYADDVGMHVWGYLIETGCWSGASAKEAFTIRNVIDEPVVEEDWS